MKRLDVLAFTREKKKEMKSKWMNKEHWETKKKFF